MNAIPWFHRPTLEELVALCRDTAAEHLGIEFTAVGDDFLSARMPVDHRTVQPMRLLHGGALVLLAESVGSAAGNYCVDPHTHYAVGLDINANHLRSLTQGWAHGTARPIHVGRRTQVWEIRIAGDDGRLVCVSRLTMSVLEREAVKGDAR